MSWISWTKKPKPFAADEAAQKEKAKSVVKETMAANTSPPEIVAKPSVKKTVLPPLEIAYRQPFDIFTKAPELDVQPVPQVAPVQPGVQAQTVPKKANWFARSLLAGAVITGGYVAATNIPAKVPEKAPESIVAEPPKELPPLVTPRAATILNGTINLQCQVVDGQLPPVTVPPPKVDPPKVDPPVPPVVPPVTPPPVVVPPTPPPVSANEFEPGTILYGFKGLGGIFDEAAFNQFAIERGLVPVVIKSWEWKKAVNELVDSQKDFKQPYALYGFSIGGQTNIKAVEIVKAMMAKGKPAALPVAVFTIGTSSVINFKGAFDNVKVVEFYFHANTKHDVDGKMIKAPHTGSENIQQKVADMFKKGK